MADRRIGPVDAFVLLLAIASVALVLYQIFGDPSPQQARVVNWLEYGIVSLFALEFLLTWMRHDHKGIYLLRNWYEILALIPVTGGPATALPFFPVLRIVVLLSRFGRVVDRLFGDEAFYRALDRIQNIVVEWIADAVTLRVLDQTLLVLQKATFTRNLATHLERHGAEMEEVILEKVKADPALARFRGVPFFDDIVAVTSGVGRRIVIETLRDSRMEQMVRDVIRDNVKQIRDEVDKLESLKAAT